MEELGVYRYRIGVFTCVAYRKSSNNRTPTRKQKTRPVSKRKVKVKKTSYNHATKAKNKFQDDAHHSRIAFLFLLVFIPLMVSNKFLYVNNNLLYGKAVSDLNIDQIRQYSGDLLDNFTFTFHNKTNALRKQRCLQTNSLFTDDNFSVYEIETKRHRIEKTRNTLLNSPNIISGEDILANIEQLICDKVFLITVNNTTGRQLRCQASLSCYIGIILVCIMLLCCLGTCSYLLGNKGAHCYHGNPSEWEENKKPGDAWLTQQTLKMIKNHVDESVGLIRIKKYDSNGARSIEGTGFRAGTRYVITAYHVFKAEIDEILDNVKYEVDSKNKDSIFRKISEELHVTSSETDKGPSLSEVRGQIDKYVKQIYTNIPKLLSLLEDCIDTEALKNNMTQKWKESCAVIFIGEREFQVDWQIPFGDKDTDIVIVSLIDSASLPFPEPLLLDKNFQKLNNIHIIRFMGDDQVVLDQSTTTFKDDNELEKCIKGAVEWWKQKFPSEDESFFFEKYQDCVKSHDIESGRVVLKASKSFTYGASGSPIVYLFNSDGRPVVGMIYQRGHPKFYYTAQAEGSGTFYNVKINKDKCLLEGGTTMKKLAELLDLCELKGLREDIFALPEKMTPHEVVAKEFQRILQGELKEVKEIVKKTNDKQEETCHLIEKLYQKIEMKRIEEKLKKVEDLIKKTIDKQEEASGLNEKQDQKIDPILTRPNFIDSQKLNTMIEQTRVQVMTHTSSNPYVKTEAHMAAEDILKLSNTIVITGNPGDGKTVLAYQLMKSMSSADNTVRCLRPLMLHNSEQFHELVEPSNALCVMIDDIFGSVVAESYKLQSWGNILGTLFSSFQTGSSSQNNVLIVTLRKDILNSCLPQKSHLFKEEITLDLTLKRFKTKTFMSKLLDAYLLSSENFKPFTEKELDIIHKHSPNIGFPQCCKMASENNEFRRRGIEFFANPNQFLLQELNHLLTLDEGKNKYCSLLFLFLYPKYSFNDASEDDTKEKQILKCMKKLYGYKWRGKENLRQTLCEMSGLYIRRDGDKDRFRFSHESIQTAIAISFASKYTSYFIQLCESRRLHILVTNNETDIHQGVVRISDNDIPCLVDRIKQLLQTKENNRAQIFRHIADMQVWNSKKFTANWSKLDENKLISVYHLDEKGNSMLVYFSEREMLIPLELCFSTSTIDKMYKTQLNLGLKSACKTGNLELVDYFLSKTVNPNISIFTSAVKGRNLDILSKLIEKYPTVLKYGRDVAQFYPFCLPTSVTVLHYACYEGNICMVRHICERCESLVNITDGQGRNCLHIASFQGHVDVCEYLLKSFPFLLYETYQGRLPIHETAESGNIRCFNLIDEYVARTNSSIQSYISAVTDQDETIYHLACKGAKKEMCMHIQKRYPFLLAYEETLHPLHAAAWSGDIELFQTIRNNCCKENKEMCSEDFVLSCMDRSGSSVLHFACKNGKTEMCKYIIDKYPELINIKNVHEYHALHLISFTGDLACFIMLLDAALEDASHAESFLVDTLSRHGESVLHIACRMGNINLCKYIIDKHPKLLNIRRIQGQHALHEAAWSGNITCFELLINKLAETLGVDKRDKFVINCLDDNRRSVLHFAAHNGKPQMCCRITETFPTLLHIRRNNDVHALHDAAWSGEVECFKSIVKKIEENKREMQHIEEYLDQNGSTVLHLAIRGGSTDMCKLIVDTYPKLLNSKNVFGHYAIHEAVSLGNISCLIIVVDKATEDMSAQESKEYIFKYVDEDQFTPLHLACQNGKTEMCRYIIEMYPSLLNARHETGMHALHYAAWSGAISCLELMISKLTEDTKYDISNCVDNQNSTILHHAICGRNIDMCRFVIERYPNLVNAVDLSGLTVLHEAASAGDIPCLEMLIDKLSEDKTHEEMIEYISNCLDENGCTILHIASRHGRTDMCRFIIEKFPFLLTVKRNDGWLAINEMNVSENTSDLIYTETEEEEEDEKEDEEDSFSSSSSEADLQNSKDISYIDILLKCCRTVCLSIVAFVSLFIFCIFVLVSIYE